MKKHLKSNEKTSRGFKILRSIESFFPKDHQNVEIRNKLNK